MEGRQRQVPTHRSLRAHELFLVTFLSLYFLATISYYIYLFKSPNCLRADLHPRSNQIEKKEQQAS